MSGAVDHGPILSDDEYQRRVVELYSGLPPMPSKEADLEIRRRELDLLIDHRLGCRFPRDRRDALWQAQCHIEKKRVRLAFSSLTRALVPRRFRHGVEGLAGFVVNEYAKVLDPDELTRFLDLEDGKPPGLPFDRPA